MHSDNLSYVGDRGRKITVQSWPYKKVWDPIWKINWNKSARPWIQTLVPPKKHQIVFFTVCSFLYFHQCVHYSTSSPSPEAVSLFNVSHFSGCVALAHYAFAFLISILTANDIKYFSCVNFPSIYLLWRNVCSNIIPICWVVFLLLTWRIFIYFENESFVRYMHCWYFISVWGLSINFCFKTCTFKPCEDFRKVEKIVKRISTVLLFGIHKC
jgi:hypothetical protein